MTVRVTAEADTRQGPGHAVIRIEGAKVAPDGVRFLVRRPGYREDSLGPGGWQAAEAYLTPEAAYVAHGALVLHVGPDMVTHMEPGMNVAFAIALPDGSQVDGQLAWPAIAGPIGGAGARRGRMVATQRMTSEPAAFRTGGALVGDAPPPQRAAPRPVPATVAVPPPEAASAPELVAATVAAGPEPAAAQVDGEEPKPSSVSDETSAAAEGGHRRFDLRAERDQQGSAAAAAERRTPWKGRVAVTASIALLLLAGAAAASIYLGRDQICASESVGSLADDWGLCPPVIVAEAPPPAPEEPGATADGGGWSINPLTWLGPRSAEPEADRGADSGDSADPADSAEEPPSPESQRALARQFLEGQPTPEEAFARANELREEGQVEAAFLIYRYAAELDHADSAVAVAAMYDPETFTPQTSPLPRPNPTVARRWYERAVSAGDDQALISLARMLVAQDQVEEARAVLRRAEQAGLTEAAGQLLEELE